MLKFNWNSPKHSLLITWFLIVTIETTHNMTYRNQSRTLIMEQQEMILTQQQTIMKHEDHIKVLYILKGIRPSRKSQPDMSRDSILIKYNGSETGWIY